jgi:DnaK suppressor protein
MALKTPDKKKRSVAGATKPLQKKPAKGLPDKNVRKKKNSARVGKITEKEPPLSEEERKVALLKLLRSKKETIIKEARIEISKFIKGETKQLVDTALDNGDWSIIDLSEDISLRKLSSHRETLLKIDEALRKLKEGTYGICEDCGDDISENRLKVMPFAIYCRDCQENRENLAKFDQEGMG